MVDTPALHLFQAVGVELEYMIVDADTLSVRPIADKVLHGVAGEYVDEVELGEISWSNELALHVIELKTTGPAASFEPLSAAFQEHLRRINELLAPMGARLMPTAAHPWMDPAREMKLWPHHYSPIYDAYNRIFDCSGHGWANLQSVHLNLPFADDAEFGRLHAAIRLVLPIMPALAASSPMIDRRLTGLLDSRLAVYRTNSLQVPSVTGKVIPEPVFTRADYEETILGTMYRDIAPYDPEGILQHEWLNARGAIARFDRSTIEIRVLDVQECPAADVAICAAITRVLQALVSERWTSTASQQSLGVDPLEKIFLTSIRDADQAVVDDPAYLEQFGFSSAGPCTAGELWRHLVAATERSRILQNSGDSEQAARILGNSATDCEAALKTILDRGPLARRITDALTPTAADPATAEADGTRSVPATLAPERVAAVYRELCDCLNTGRMFLGCE